MVQDGSPVAGPVRDDCPVAATAWDGNLVLARYGIVIWLSARYDMVKRSFAWCGMVKGSFPRYGMVIAIFYPFKTHAVINDMEYCTVYRGRGCGRLYCDNPFTRRREVRIEGYIASTLLLSVG